MSLTAFRNTLYAALVLISCLSCNQQDTKQSADRLNKVFDTSTEINNSHSVEQSAQSKKLNFDNWDTFWENFTAATGKHDTSTITGLTNFPFSQNSYPIYQDEFVECCISQLLDLRKVDTAVLIDEVLLQIKPYKTDLLKFDSVRYTNKKGRDFYFAKVNGNYRLVEIITPG